MQSMVFRPYEKGAIVKWALPGGAQQRGAHVVEIRVIWTAFRLNLRAVALNLFQVPLRRIDSGADEDVGAPRRVGL